jgi:hypothetical protein
MAEAASFEGLAALANEGGVDLLSVTVDAGVVDSEGNVVGSGEGVWTLYSPEDGGEFMTAAFTITDESNRNLNLEITDPDLAAVGTYVNYKLFNDGDCGQVNFFNAKEDEETIILSDIASEEGTLVTSEGEELCWDGTFTNADCTALTTTCEIQEI